MRSSVIIILLFTLQAKCLYSQQWLPINEDPGTMIYCMAVDTTNGLLYAGGQFDQIGGVSAKNIAVWNGDTWNNLANGLTDAYGGGL